MTEARVTPSAVVAGLALAVLLSLGWPLAHLPIPAGLWLGRRLGDLGMNLAEVCMLLVGPRSAVLARLELAGQEHVEKAGAEGKGVLRLSVHLGNWELLPAAQALTPFEVCPS